MSVTLPIFQSTPTLNQMKSIDYYDSNIPDTTRGILSEASNGDIYVARLTNLQEWIDIFGGTSTVLNFSYSNCYILYEKETSDKIRWAYAQTIGESVLVYSPWQAGIIIYNGNNYKVATPYASYNTLSQFYATGCWANCPVYSSAASFFSAESPAVINANITYRLTNATTIGPNEANIGDTVTVPLTFPEGYGVVNSSSDAYVTCNGVLVPSTYSDGQLVFTMPDPSQLSD